MVSFLLKLGADPTLRDETGKTALDIAKFFKNKKSIQVLSDFESNQDSINSKKELHSFANESLINELKSLKSDISQLKKENESKKKEVEDLTNKIGDLLHEVMVKDKRIKTLEMEIKELNSNK